MKFHYPKFTLLNFLLHGFLSCLLAILAALLVAYLTTPRIPILGFHGVIDLGHPNSTQVYNHITTSMDYTTHNLEELLEYLVQHQYWFLSSQELYDFFIARTRPIPPERKGQRPIMITFDDSYKSTYSNVLPILEKLNQQYSHPITVVSFVNPGTVVAPDRPSSTYLSCDDIRTGFASGYYDVQSHGLSHKRLTDLSPVELTAELADAQTQLRACIGDLDPQQQVARHLAYPFGATNSQVESYVSKYYQSGYLYDSHILRFCWLHNHYLISRFSVSHDKSPQRLIQMAERSPHLQSNKLC